MNTLGIDIGGKTIKYGICNGEKILMQGTYPTPYDQYGLTELLIRIISDSDCETIGIGVPGLIKNGVILNAPNLGIRNLSLVDRLPLAPILLNDADAAMVAEAAFGGAKDVKNAVLLTIGTGIGGAILIDGKLYSGQGGAAELGHMSMGGNIRCACGRKGCFETLASASSIEREYYSVTKKTLSAKEIFALSDSGNEIAAQVIDRFIANLSDGILNIANILRPEIFILGGGISERKDKLIKPLKQYVASCEYGYLGAPAFDIHPARFSSDAGIIGAAKYAEDQTKRTK